MPKFRKKPVIIEAWQWNNDGSDDRPNFWEEVQNWFSKEYDCFKESF